LKKAGSRTLPERTPSLRALYPLLNNKLLGRLRIALLDFAEGAWRFRDELGRRKRRSW
jgi:hypothetical protein